MGSEGVFVDVDEAAAILDVTPQMVNKYVENGLLPCHYPDAKNMRGRGPRRFRREDVETLDEMKRAGLNGDLTTLKNHMIGMAVKVKRLERTLEELQNYLGMTDHKLPVEYDDVIQLHNEAQEIADGLLDANDVRDVAWARRLLPISEEFLNVVKEHTKDEKPWDVYMRSLKRLLEVHTYPGPVRAVLEHALMNLRNAAFFYVCNQDGVRMAKRAFPHAHYSNRLYGIMFPPD